MCSSQESINFTRKFSCQKAAPTSRMEEHITNEKLLAPGKRS